MDFLVILISFLIMCFELQLRRKKIVFDIQSNAILLVWLENVASMPVVWLFSVYVFFVCVYQIFLSVASSY